MHARASCLRSAWAATREWALGVQAAVRATGIHSLHEQDLKYSLEAATEEYGAPFACCVWLLVVASFVAQP